MRSLPMVSPSRRRAFWAALAGAVLVMPAMASVIDINSYRFDPLSREPAIPAALLATPTEGPTLYLLQFKGPVEESWKAELASLGVQFFGYIPENAFIVRMDRGVSEKARSRPFVRWVGPYHPAYRISPEIGQIPFRDPERARDPLRTLMVYVAQDPFSTAASASLLGTVLGMIDDPMLPGFVLHVDPARVAQVAALSDVVWVEEKPETFILNNTTKWVVQSNVSPQVPIWDQGIFGEGQILCEMDTGLDYNSCWFRDIGQRPPGPAPPEGDRLHDLGRERLRRLRHRPRHARGGNGGRGPVLHQRRRHRLQRHGLPGEDHDAGRRGGQPDRLQLRRGQHPRLADRGLHRRLHQGGPRPHQLLGIEQPQLQRLCRQRRQLHVEPQGLPDLLRERQPRPRRGHGGLSRHGQGLRQRRRDPPGAEPGHRRGLLEPRPDGGRPVQADRDRSGRRDADLHHFGQQQLGQSAHPDLHDAELPLRGDIHGHPGGRGLRAPGPRLLRPGVLSARTGLGAPRFFRPRRS